jgi:putative endonuclease
MLRCADQTLYTWITTDLDRRVTEHNSATIGAKYTKARRPVQLVWSVQVLSRTEAAQEELRIKKMSRAQKIALLR